MLVISKLNMISYVKLLSDNLKYEILFLSQLLRKTPLPIGDMIIYV